MRDPSASTDLATIDLATIDLAMPMRTFRASGHVPAHAMPPPKRPKGNKIPFRRAKKQHAAPDSVRAPHALGARRAVTSMRQWLDGGNHAPRIPDVANMVVVRESVWDRCARTARTPAFGAATAAYLVCAWIVVGATASPPPADDGSSTAQDAGVSPSEGTREISDGSGVTTNSRGTGEPSGGAPAVQIDSQFFSSLQKAVNDVDAQTPGDVRTAPLPYHADPPALDTSHLEASVIAPPPEAVANPNGQPGDVPASDPLVPGAVIAPPPQAVVNPNGETAEAPALVPGAPVIAPPQAVVTPNGQTADTTSQQPLGPLPGPAA